VLEQLSASVRQAFVDGHVPRVTNNAGEDVARGVAAVSVLRKLERLQLAFLMACRPGVFVPKSRRPSTAAHAEASATLPLDDLGAAWFEAFAEEVPLDSASMHVLWGDSDVLVAFLAFERCACVE